MVKNKKIAMSIVILIIGIFMFTIGIAKSVTEYTADVYTINATPYNHTQPPEVIRRLCINRLTAYTVELKKLLKVKPIIFSDIVYTKFYSADMCTKNLNAANDAATQLQEAIASNEYTKEAEAAMSVELSRVSNVINKYQSDIDHYTAWEAEYYYAAKTWQYFKLAGYSDAATCGIIGNMMVETNNGSLELRPTIYNPSRAFYGLCQWSLTYYPSVANKPFEDQLLFLEETIFNEFDCYGKLYKQDFTLEDFIRLDDPAEAALAFAKVYERCGTGSYELRKQSAKKAYDYFVIE